MGMFDEVLCERLMPDGFDGRGAGFQTKDFDCTMAVLEIRDDGLLTRRRWCEDTERLTERAELIDFHGFFSFYTYEKGGRWHEYTAKFTDGRMVEIRTDDEANRHANANRKEA